MDHQPTKWRSKKETKQIIEIPKNSHEHSTHTHHPLREKAKVNSFLSHQETKQNKKRCCFTGC
jgi:hypothetical protein